MQNNVFDLPQIDRPDLAQLLVPARVIALQGPDSVIHPQVIQSIATRTTHAERVGLIIGHNRFALYALSRWARHHRIAPSELLERIDLSRSFTCFQLHQRISRLDAKTTNPWRTLYVLGLLDTFYDESVDYSTAARLLHASLAHLKRIAGAGLPVLITISLPKQPGREGLIELVRNSADQNWAFESTAPISKATQMPLRVKVYARR